MLERLVKEKEETESAYERKLQMEVTAVQTQMEDKLIKAKKVKQEVKSDSPTVFSLGMFYHHSLIRSRCGRN